MQQMLDRRGIDELVTELMRNGYLVVGPTIRDGAIVFSPIDSTADLPVGWTDLQSPGAYDLESMQGDHELFGYAVGPESMKRTVSPPTQILFAAVRDDEGDVMASVPPVSPPIAIIGVRGCDLAAARVTDRVQLASGTPDAFYAATRDSTFVVAVDCARPSGSCFCTSVGGSPAAGDGHDLALTEVPTEDGFHYVIRVGSARGAAILAAVGAAPAGPGLVAAAERILREATESMPVRFDPETIRTALTAGRRSAQWDVIAERCLACGNCTAVCPTCFCGTVTDRTDLVTGEWTRSRVWDSCFSLGFSEIHGHPHRSSIAARYRQWITHKLSSWYDQFGESGCVGCGRCITWCPVGIDLVAEAIALSQSQEATA